MSHNWHHTPDCKVVHDTQLQWATTAAVIKCAMPSALCMMRLPILHFEAYFAAYQKSYAARHALKCKMGNHIMQRVDVITKYLACMVCEALEQTAKHKCASSNCDSVHVHVCRTYW